MSGLTLRKKRTQRPVISGPTPSSNNLTRPVPLQAGNESSFSIPRERNAPSETSDLVKRRYSTRFNQLPDLNGDAPPMPALPGQLKRRSGPASPHRPRTSGSAHPLQIDHNILSSSNLNHEKYVTDLLANASEEDIAGYQGSLRRVKDNTLRDLKQSVFQNRTQFIRISKEAEKLKGEMAVLQTLMADLTTTLEHTNTGMSNGSSVHDISSEQSRKMANRSSIANLENMWNVQLQTLWKTIEKSQKFLPAAPGRHVVMETSHWVELDSATWKPKRPIQIVLLNDHLLIASKKRKRMDPNAPQQGPPPTKTVAEECWPLQDIDLIDMVASLGSDGSAPAESRAVAAAFTVRSGGRSLTYRHEKRDEEAKNKVLLTFRKTLEDLRKASKTEQEKTNPQQDSLTYFATRDAASAQNVGIIESINSANAKGGKQAELTITVDGKQHSFRWIESQLDDLDISIALQRFDESVSKVEGLRILAKNLQNNISNTNNADVTNNNNSIAQDLILVKVDERAAKLAAILTRDLADKPSFMETTKRTTSFLSRLGYEDIAREIYLNSRGENLTRRARQCVFEGDLHRYIFSLSYVYFTIIKNTVLIFQASFTAATISAVIKWAHGHLEIFNEVLVRQLSFVEKGEKVWRDCMDVVWGLEREMLGEVGLDFREVVGRGLEDERRVVEPPKSTGDGERKGRTRSGSQSAAAKARKASRSKSRPAPGQ